MALRSSRLAAVAAGLLTCSAATLYAQTATPHGAILVRVADANDQPLWGGDIDLPVLDVHFSVPDGGRLLIKDVPPGTYVVQAKRIGYALERRLVKVGTDTTRVQFTMYPGTTLDTVKVTSFADSWASDFDRRRKLGFGSSFNAADIQDAQASQLSSFLKRARGVIVSVGEPDVVHSTRASGRCGMMQIFWDGQLMNAPESSPGTAKVQSAPRGGYGNATAFDINSIPLRLIGGIEVYTNVATIPALFASPRDECGVILLWSK